MTSPESCAFCNPEILERRIIRLGETCLSIVSLPRFREGHVLVIPRRHVVRLSDLTSDEGAEMMLEAGRLGEQLDMGYGTGMMQKYQPTQTENGVKMDHLHLHIFPRLEHEMGLFPVPEPNDFHGFDKEVPIEELTALAQKLR